MLDESCFVELPQESSGIWKAWLQVQKCLGVYKANSAKSEVTGSSAPLCGPRHLATGWGCLVSQESSFSQTRAGRSPLDLRSPVGKREESHEEEDVRGKGELGDIKQTVPSLSVTWL